MPRPVTTEDELWDRALALLSRRAHARAELCTKLRRYQPSVAQLDAVLARLEQAGWLNDAQFARDRADSMVRQGRAGPARIQAQLRKHGVARAEVDSTMAETEADWFTSCRALAQDRARRGLDLTDPKDRSRLVRFLLGRGFTYDQIGRAVRDIGVEADGSDAD